MFTLSAMTSDRRTAGGALRPHAGRERERERERERILAQAILAQDKGRALGPLVVNRVGVLCMGLQADRVSNT